MEKFFLIVTINFFCFAVGQTPTDKEYNLLVGTYTNPEKTNGIHVYNFNTEDGDFSFKFKAVDIINPSYLAISKDKKNVYAVSESGNGNGRINSFSFNPISGELIFLNSVSSGGDGPAYVSVDDKKQYVFSGNYGGGSVAAIKVKEDGSLENDNQSIKHKGNSVNKPQQNKPHVHAAVLSPDDDFLLTPDLGTDKVNVYRYNPHGPQPLTLASPPFTRVEAGGGPRHLTFHPNGKFAYLVLEMTAAVVAFDYNDGKLITKQTISMLAPGFDGDVEAADIHVSPDGKFLYASNRGDANELVIFAIDKMGELDYVGRQSDLIHTPRNFAIDPTGNFLLVANMGSNDIIIFKRDKNSGLLTPTGKKILVDKPVCLKFVAVN
jgi:6-phosphogluconolactonase